MSIDRGTEDLDLLFEEWGLTVSKADTFTYTWNLGRLDICRKYCNEDLESPQFYDATNKKLIWRLRLEIDNHDKSLCREYSSLCLELVSSDMRTIRAKYKVSILNLKGEKVNEFSGTSSFSSVEKRFTKFIPFDFLFDCSKVMTFLPNPKLKIICEITVLQYSVASADRTKPVQINVPDCSLSDDLCQLFENQEFSDVILSVDGYGFKVHKNILAARSPVFAAMFKHDMKERNTGIVKIDDVSQDVMEEVLRFVYTGKVLNIDKMADDLLTAADKYQLDRLKAMCEKSLRKNLSIQNASDMLVFADFHKADQLKSQTIDFMNANVKSVIKTAKFKTLMDTHPRLIPENFFTNFLKQL